MSYYVAPSKWVGDAFVTYQCLVNSLTLDFLKLVTANFRVPVIMAIKNGKIPSAAYSRRGASVRFMSIPEPPLCCSSALHSPQLDAKMIELESNIVEYNLYFNSPGQGPISHRQDHWQLADQSLQGVQGHQ